MGLGRGLGEAGKAKKEGEGGGNEAKKEEKKGKAKEKKGKEDKKGLGKDRLRKALSPTKSIRIQKDLQELNQSDVEQILNQEEKRFLLYVERGDTASVQHILKRALKENLKRKGAFNINCLDPLGRSALHIAIENENFDLIEELLRNGINAGDALLHAVAEEYVEGVSVLIAHEENIHKPGDAYSWEAVRGDRATFTADITPLILAAHRNNYEILKLLLDRGATLPMPHDIKCACDQCIASNDMDSLRHSLSRINAYKALASPSLIALSSKDPIATSISLTTELKKLAVMENEFRKEYRQLRTKVQNFSSDLIQNTRSSYEIEVLLNYSEDGDVYVPGEHMKLLRLREAVDKHQKHFVSHANVQQLLSNVWYDGMPGFKRKGMFRQLMEIGKIGAMFPMYSCAYIFAPNSKLGVQMTKPFIKFIVHSSSYFFFLMLLVMVSQRVETIVIDLFGSESMVKELRKRERESRGSLPSYVEMLIIIYVFGFIFREIRALWVDGLMDFLKDLWNLIDFTINFFYMNWIILRLTAWFQVKREIWSGLNPYLPREEWHPFDPMLIAEGMFGAANIFSFLKLVHIFSVNPHLGPLQISLGRMVIDIIKFFFIYSLVLFAFGCGLNNLLWYYAAIDKNKCYSLPGGKKNPKMGLSCTIWRRFSNLFETAQTLFWASFGIIDLFNFDLAGIKPFTRFWSMLMFGSYNVINVIVLLNLLIAMMSNSYSTIVHRADLEWKFARSKLWMSYFEEGQEVPSPFNLIPNIRSITRAITGEDKTVPEDKETRDLKRDVQYAKVMRNLIRRYITEIQRRCDENEVTEDDVNEIKQSITSCKYEILNILRINGWQTYDKHINRDLPMGHKQTARERRLKKGFNIGMVEGLDLNNILVKEKKTHVDILSDLVLKAWTSKGVTKRDWNREMLRSRDPIGSSSEMRERASLRQARRTRWKKVQYFHRQGVFIGGEINTAVLDETTKKCKAEEKKSQGWGRLVDMKDKGRLTYNYYKHAEEMRKDMESAEGEEGSPSPSPSPTPSASPTPAPSPAPSSAPTPSYKFSKQDDSKDSQKSPSTLAPPPSKKPPQPQENQESEKPASPKPPPTKTDPPKPPATKTDPPKPADTPKPPPTPAPKRDEPPKEPPKPAETKPAITPKPPSKKAAPKAPDNPKEPAPAASKPAADPPKPQSRPASPRPDDPNLISGISAITKQRRTGWL